MNRFFAVAVVLIMMFASVAWGQQGPGPGGRGMMRGGGPMYDPSKAETVTGQVTEVKEFSGMRGMGQGVGLTVKTGDKNIIVHLGPKFYLDEQTIKIAAGDTVEITGVRSMRRGQDMFMAGQVKKNGEVLKLRDEAGIPLWAGKGPRAVGPGPTGAAGDQAKPRPKAPIGC